MKLPFVGVCSRFSLTGIQPLFLFLMGSGFLILGLRSYPAFIAVGSLFIVIAYRGYTCRRNN